MRLPGAFLCLLATCCLLACNPGPDAPAKPDAMAARQGPDAVNDPGDESDDGSDDGGNDIGVSGLDGVLPDVLARITEAWYGDLDGMVDRRVIRTLVAAGGPQFFYDKGRPRGIMAELLGLFQEELNVGLDRRLDQVEILPMPTSRDRLIPALLNGQADLVAVDLTVTKERSELVDFSVPLARNVSEVVVFAPGQGEEVRTLDDLAGKKLYVRRSSSYYEHLVELAEGMASRGIDPPVIEEAHEYLRPQDILEMVNAGMVDATVIDSWKADYWSELLGDLQIRPDLVVHEGGVVAWAFRKDSPKLAAAVNGFVRGHQAGTLIGNVLINRYLGNIGWVSNATSGAGYEKIRPLLDMFEAAGVETRIDPLMLAAQAYQESELDHDRVSPVGAMGLMQIKPSTAADPNVGVADISAPADNVRAGAKYMRFLMDRYFSDPGMDPIQSWVFALAAYNAGPARIQQLRSLARNEGHDPNVWVENVELVAARKIGRETVRYVRNVFKYYIAYKMATGELARWQALGAE